MRTFDRSTTGQRQATSPPSARTVDQESARLTDVPFSSAVALLRAATLTGPAAVEAARAWGAATDLDRLPPEQFPLLPLAIGALEQAHPGAPWLPRLRGVYRRAWYANRLMVGAVAQLAQALSAAGIPFLLADAVPLSLSVYADRLRPIDALDLIVPPDRVHAAGCVITAQGWQDLAPTNVTHGAVAPWAAVRRFRSAVGQRIDLHGRVAAFWPSQAVDAAAWARAQSLSMGDQPVRAVSAADQLARSCRAAMTPGPAALIALADATALLARAEVDWDAVIETAALGHVGRTLLHVCEGVEALLGICAPADALARLRALPLSPFEARERRCDLPCLGQPSRAQALAAAYAHYRRVAAAHGLAPRWGDFLTMIQCRWGCASRWELWQRAVRWLIQRR